MAKLITTNSDGKAISQNLQVYEGTVSSLDNPALYDTLAELRAINFLAQSGNVSTNQLGLDQAVRNKLALLQAIDDTLLDQLASLANIITELQTRLPGSLSPNSSLKVAVVETDPKCKTVDVSTTYVPLATGTVTCTHCLVNNPNSIGIRVVYNSSPSDYYLLAPGQSETFITTNVANLSARRNDDTAGNVPVSYHAFVRQ